MDSSIFQNSKISLKARILQKKNNSKLKKSSQEYQKNNWEIKTSSSISEDSFDFENSGGGSLYRTALETERPNEDLDGVVRINQKLEESYEEINEKKVSENNLSLIQKKIKKDFTKNPNYKTEICKNFEVFGKCEWLKNCCFAHGKNELREKSNFNSNYKTKICKNYHFKGFCLYGSRCQYYHFKSNNTFSELLNSFKNQEFDFFEKSKQFDLLCDASGQQLRQRLRVFKTIFKADF